MKPRYIIDVLLIAVLALCAGCEQKTQKEKILPDTKNIINESLRDNTRFAD